MVNSTGKDAHHLVVGKCKSKPQRDATSNPSGWLLPKAQKTTRDDDDVEKLKPLALLMGM